MADKTSKSGKPLGPIGTKVLFENEHIRVWSVELPPKGHQPLHEHEHPYLAIINTAASRGCDLIVMASHGRHGVAALVLGSETFKVLTHCKIPVLVHR